MQISILQCLAIIFVVAGHVGGLNIFGEWFPIYSFHIPLWFFISGYLYKNEVEESFRRFLWKKVKRLVIPYFILNTCYGIIALFLTKKHIIDYGIKGGWEDFLIKPWQEGNQFGLDMAGWFVLALFLTQILYVSIRVILKKIEIENEYIIGVLLLFLGMLGVTLAYLGFRTGWYLTGVRVCYALPFYHLGRLYHLKLESKDKLGNGLYFAIAFLISYGMQIITENNLYIGVWNADFNKFVSTPIVSFLTPLAGIMFWLRISRFLSEYIKDNKLVKFISRNTWSIMMHQQFVLLIINYILLKVHQCADIMESFNVEAFRTNAWFTYKFFGNNNSLIFYTALLVIIPLAIKYLLITLGKRNRFIKSISRIF